MIFSPFILGSLSGILSTLAQANPFFQKGIPWMSFICLTPLFVAWMNSNSHQQSQIAGFTYCVFSTLGQCFWLAFFGDFSLWTLGGTLIGYILFFLIFSLYIWHIRISPFINKPLIFALTWVVYEISKSTGFTAYPWGLVSHPLHSWGYIIQIVDTIGVFGLSFFVAFFNACLAEYLIYRFSHRVNKKFSFHCFKTCISCFCFFLIYGCWIFSQIPSNPEAILPTILVQTNEDPWKSNKEIEALKQSIQLSKEGLKDHPETKLVIWSETLLKRLYYDQFYQIFPQEGENLRDFLASYSNISWIIGAPSFLWRKLTPKEEKEFQQKTKGLIHSMNNEVQWANFPANRNPYQMTNAMLFINKKGIINDFYSKRFLVPFAENIPFIDIFPFSWLYQTIGLSGTWAKGKRNNLFNLDIPYFKTIKIGPLICFEDAFDLAARENVRNGADLLVNITNDSWSKTQSAEWQHHIVALFRTIENRRTLVRSTNGGITSVIDPWGRTVLTLPPFQSKQVFYEVPIYTKEKAPYTKIGDSFLYILTLTLLLYPAYLFYKKKKDKEITFIRKKLF